MTVSSKHTSIYADYNSTVPLDDAHLDAVVAALREFDGNPSSQHATGRRAKVAVEEARSRVANLVGCRAQEIIFTSGATEANNLVIQGVAGKQADGAGKPHVIIGATEHSSVIEVAQVLAERGRIALSVAPVDRDGRISRDDVIRLINRDTVLVCVMMVNNETGAINPVAELAGAVKERNPLIHFHTDAVQGLGKVDISFFARTKIDSAAFSGHKIGAFKGCGALFLKAGSKLQALMLGGGQERARRPGTENVPGIISFGLRARDLASAGQGAWEGREREVQARFVAALRAIDGAVIHGDPVTGVANTVNFHIDRVSGDDLLLNLDLSGIAASSGSACSSGVGRPSHVLLAMGYPEWVALNSVRISFGPGSEVADADRIIEVVKQVASRKAGSQK